MRGSLLLFVPLLFLAACFKPVETYVGMSYDSFDDLCEVTSDEHSTNSVSNSSGDFFTVTLENTETRREKQLWMKGCIGTFTFRNSKLDTITR